MQKEQSQALQDSDTTRKDLEDSNVFTFKTVKDTSKNLSGLAWFKSLFQSSQGDSSKSKLSITKCDNEMEYCRSRPVNEKCSLAKRKLDLLTGRTRLPWIEGDMEDSTKYCERCLNAKVQQESQQTPSAVLEKDNISPSSSFENSFSDRESAYMASAKLSLKPDANFDEKLERIRRIVELLNGQALLRYITENSN